MLEVDVNNILPVTDARTRIATLVDEVMKGNLYVLTRGGKPAVVVAPIQMADNALMSKNSAGVGSSSNLSKSLPIKVKAQKQVLVPVEKKEILPTLKEEIPEPVLVEDTSQLPAQSSRDQSVAKPDPLDDESMPMIDLNKVNRAIEEAEQN